jgi:hypothetical protein
MVTLIGCGEGLGLRHRSCAFKTEYVSSIERNCPLCTYVLLLEYTLCDLF